MRKQILMKGTNAREKNQYSKIWVELQMLLFTTALSGLISSREK